MTFAEHVDRLWMLRVHTERLADLVLEPGESSRSSSNGTASSTGNNRVQEAVELHQVDLRSGVPPLWVFQGSSLQIAPGETTLAKLLLCLEDRTGGKMFIDGIPAASMPVAGLWAKLGVVMKDDMLLGGSIAQNIAGLAAETDIAWVEQRASDAQIHTTIPALPLGNDTLIDEAGMNFSAGQRPRIMNAWALYPRSQIYCLTRPQVISTSRWRRP